MLKLSFNDMAPAVWRRFVMPENATFKRLFDTVMNVTNFDGDHLYKFDMENLTVTNAEELSKAAKRKSYEGKPVKSPTTKIDSFILEGPIKLTYDFGDSWEMIIELEKIVEDYYFGYPTLLAMEGAAPPENIGGVSGFKEYKDIMANPKHPLFLKMHEWTDAVQFIERDFDMINSLLKQVKYQKTEWDKLEHDKYVLLKDAYRRADVYGVDEVPEHKEVLQYMIASANLYGYLPMHKFLQIYNNHHKQPITATDVEVVATYSAKQLQKAHVKAYTNAIVLDDFEYMQEGTFNTRSFGKPYYIPSRKQFLKYVDGAYTEETPAIKALTKIVEKDLAGQPALAKHLMAQLLARLKSEVNFSETVKQFISHIPIKNTIDLNIYIELITNVANSTRLWVNRGYTPSELSSLERGVVSVEEQPAKVGRNDKCPCGSGKKYKKCCGK